MTRLADGRLWLTSRRTERGVDGFSVGGQAIPPGHRIPMHKSNECGHGKVNYQSTGVAWNVGSGHGDEAKTSDMSPGAEDIRTYLCSTSSFLVSLNLSTLQSPRWAVHGCSSGVQAPSTVCLLRHMPNYCSDKGFTIHTSTTERILAVRKILGACLMRYKSGNRKMPKRTLLSGIKQLPEPRLKTLTYERTHY
ncbi:hypothetical protein NCU06094 [Neurospora crassa OR74A]|uniref:Uncharacterized protein n=1 Tax=Neurospora crassa (strain ATCC 24698 / 74-OR23-1A / CBS 708.71 / DSM 1257 / FGSC 987) TaxID=367110 RepID=Q7S5J3_NEUCR|nr:hypothetical protein NCU06094 [Neurospora crassa OR74A]EAA30720.2 hypothetical protein NCU06094 [Neurospora crassa OR74A]|eukprot:XP_959956.2 hypothetical protein NCU06094 [Neurospora crassa OR74A]